MTPLHEHRCACGESWVCGKRDCRDEARCTACEQALFEAWLALHPEVTQGRLEYDEDAPELAQEQRR